MARISEVRQFSIFCNFNVNCRSICPCFERSGIFAQVLLSWRSCSQYYLNLFISIHPSFSSLISLSSADYHLYPKKFRPRLNARSMDVRVRVAATFLDKTKSFCFIEKKVFQARGAIPKQTPRQNVTRADKRRGTFWNKYSGNTTCPS